MRFGWFKQGRLALVVGAGLFSSQVFAQVAYPGDGDAAISVPAPATNDPPIWNSAPNPSATAGVASAYSIAQHFQDPEGDTVTLALGPGCTLPTGVTVDNANDELDFSTGTSVGTTTGCTLTVNDGTNPSLGSAAFSIQIFAVGGATIVNSAGGDDFTTINAAINAAACGELIQVKDGTSGNYNEVVQTSQNCPANNPITVKAFPGATPSLTTSAIISGKRAAVHFLHTGFVCCEGFDINGGNPFVEEQLSSGFNLIHVNANDAVVKGLVLRGAANIAVEIRAGVQNVILDDLDIFGCGNAVEDTGLGFFIDGGNCILTPDTTPRADGMLFYNIVARMGGHSTIQIKQVNDLYFYKVSMVNDWGAGMGYTTNGGNIGNRGGSEQESDNFVWRQVLISNIRKSIDAISTQGYKFNCVDCSMSQTMMLDSRTGGMVFSITSAPGSALGGHSDVYIDHVTAHRIDGSFILRNDNSGIAGGPVYVKNVVWNDLSFNSPGGSNDQCIAFQFDQHHADGPPRTNWEQLLFVDGVVVNVDCDVRVWDTNGVDIGVHPITWYETNYPANFKNIEIVDPNFVSETVPPYTHTDFDTAWTTATTNFVPQAAAAQQAQPLTLVNGIHTTDTTILVDDAGWFRGNEGWTGRTVGDQITLCGSTVRVTASNRTTKIITLDTAISCSDNAPIYRGPDATPRMGAVL